MPVTGRFRAFLSTSKTVLAQTPVWTIMSTSRDRQVEEVYEEQNDQRLDDLHSKIRTLRGVSVQSTVLGVELNGD
jgi:hypothetical protein